MNNSIFFSLYSLAHQTTLLDWLIVFSANGFGYIMVFLAVIYLSFHTDGVFDYRAPFLQFKNKIRDITFVFSSAIVAYIFEYILKSLMPSPRPFLYFENVVPLFTHGGMDSFPSGHAMFFSALAISLFFVNKRIGYIYFVVALIVGIARVVAGVHFPIDIFAGYILGIIIAIIFKFIFREGYNKTKLFNA